MAAMELQTLRILGILGQGGSGKTSLAEAMLFAGGATQRLGRVQDGTSVFDHEPEEIKHQPGLRFEARRQAVLVPYVERDACSA